MECGCHLGGWCVASDLDTLTIVRRVYFLSGCDHATGLCCRIPSITQGRRLKQRSSHYTTVCCTGWTSEVLLMGSLLLCLLVLLAARSRSGIYAYGHVYVALLSKALYSVGWHSPTLTHAHTDGGVNHAGRQPAGQEQVKLVIQKHFVPDRS